MNACILKERQKKIPSECSEGTCLICMACGKICYSIEGESNCCFAPTYIKPKGER